MTRSQKEVFFHSDGGTLASHGNSMKGSLWKDEPCDLLVMQRIHVLVFHVILAILTHICTNIIHHIRVVFFAIAFGVRFLTVVSGIFFFMS